MSITAQILGNFEHKHETEQFHAIAKIIQRIENKNGSIFGDGYLLGNINTGNLSALDALLITTKIVLGIEFKNYPKDCTISITANSWKVLRSSDGQQIKDRLGNDLIVKGGTYDTPLEQARVNRSNMVRDMKTQLGKDKIYINFAIVFNNKVTIGIDKRDGSQKVFEDASWLTVTDNDRFENYLSVLSCKSKSIFDIKEINEYIHKIGADCAALQGALNDAIEYYKAGQIEKAYERVKTLNTKDGYRMRIMCKRKLNHGDILDTIIEAKKQDVKYAYLCHAYLLEKGFKNIAKNSTYAKELYQIAKEKGCEEAQKGIDRIEAEEKKNRSKQIEVIEERKQRESKLENLKLHDNKINIWFCSVRLYSWITIIFFYLVFFSIIDMKFYHSYIKIWIGIIFIILTGIIALCPNYDDLECIGKYMSWLDYKKLPKMIISEKSQLYDAETVYYDDTQDKKRSFHIIINAILLAISLLLFYFCLNYIAHWDFIHILDFKLFPIMRLLNSLVDWYLIMTCGFIIFYICHCYCTLNSDIRGGIKPGKNLFRYWIRLSRLLIKPCFCIACMTVFPSTWYNSFQQWNESRKMETENVEKTALPNKYSKINTDNTVRFDYGSALIKPLSVQLFKEMANILKKEPQINLIICGCIDNSEMKNDLGYLRNERAKAVRDFFCREGIDSKRITINNDSKTMQATVELYEWHDNDAINLK